MCLVSFMQRFYLVLWLLNNCLLVPFTYVWMALFSMFLEAVGLFLKGSLYMFLPSHQACLGPKTRWRRPELLTSGLGFKARCFTLARGAVHLITVILVLRRMWRYTLSSTRHALILSHWWPDRDCLIVCHPMFTRESIHCFCSCLQFLFLHLEISGSDYLKTKAWV